MKSAPIRRSRLVEQLVNFQGRPVSFEDYPITREVLDSGSRKIMMLGGRQIAKSMSLSFNMTGKIMGHPYYYMLYVAPTLTQTRTFSNDRIKARIDESKNLRHWYVDGNCIQNVMEKSFSNMSRVYFRAASQIDSIRGISSDETIVDEIQDVPSDDLPVIEETMSGKKQATRFYAGTAKTLENLSTHIWNRSSQVTPILVCEAGHHNVPYIDNIFPDGLRCKKCKARLSVRAPDMYLKAMGEPDADVTGFWIPQISLPLHVENEDKWKELYIKFQNYSKERFINEVLGLPAGSGIYMISEQDLMKACQPSFKMWPGRRQVRGITKLTAGIDWAVTNSTSFTVLTIAGYNTATNRFTVVYTKKYLDPDPLVVIKDISQKLTSFGVNQVVADWGSGFVANDLLTNYISHMNLKVMPVMYTGERKKIFWDKGARYYKASRTRTLLDLFKQIKRGRIHFFEWEKFREIKSHFLAEYAESKVDRSGNEMLRFDHSPSDPDDALHSLNILLAVWKLHNDPLNRMMP